MCVGGLSATCLLWHVQVTDIEPDQKVRAAMNEINAAQRMRMAAKEKAEADRVMVVTRAQGETLFLPYGCIMLSAAWCNDNLTAECGFLHLSFKSVHM